MFPRRQRLTNPKLFALMTRSGSWQKGRLMSARFLLTRGNSGQISFVISKKVSKLATTRNRSKRRARAVWRSLLEGDYKNVAQSSHLLIVIHRSLVDVTPKEIYVEAEGLLRQLSRRLRP